MSCFLSEIGYRELSELGERLERVAMHATCQEEFAQKVCQLLHLELLERDGGTSTVLVRCFGVVPGAQLTIPLQAMAERLSPGVSLEDVPCLTLLGTAGVESAWDDRHLSARHQVIPIQGSEALERIPMVRQLLKQLHLDVHGDGFSMPMMEVGDARRADRVFFVPDALGSPHIPDQVGFIRPYGVVTILGLGDRLPGGGAFALLLFSRVSLDPALIPSFRILTLHLRHGFELLQGKPIFRA